LTVYEPIGRGRSQTSAGARRSRFQEFCRPHQAQRRDPEHGFRGCDPLPPARSSTSRWASAAFNWGAPVAFCESPRCCSPRLDCPNCEAMVHRGTERSRKGGTGNQVETTDIIYMRLGQRFVVLPGCQALDFLGGAALTSGFLWHSLEMPDRGRAVEFAFHLDWARIRLSEHNQLLCGRVAVPRSGVCLTARRAQADASFQKRHPLLCPDRARRVKNSVTVKSDPDRNPYGSVPV
jgi:hypothetical protein